MGLLQIFSIIYLILSLSGNLLINYKKKIDNSEERNKQKKYDINRKFRNIIKKKKASSKSEGFNKSIDRCFCGIPINCRCNGG